MQAAVLQPLAPACIACMPWQCEIWCWSTCTLHALLLHTRSGEHSHPSHLLYTPCVLHPGSALLAFAASPCAWQQQAKQVTLSEERQLLCDADMLPHTAQASFTTGIDYAPGCTLAC